MSTSGYLVIQCKQVARIDQVQREIGAFRSRAWYSSSFTAGTNHIYSPMVGKSVENGVTVTTPFDLTYTSLLLYPPQMVWVTPWGRCIYICTWCVVYGVQFELHHSGRCGVAASYGVRSRCREAVIHLRPKHYNWVQVAINTQC